MKLKYPKDDLDPKWIESPINKNVIGWTESFAKHLAEGKDYKALSSSQLRKFFGNLKRIQADIKNLKHETHRLKPKLAYAVGRDKKKDKHEKKYISQTEITTLYKEFSKVFDEVDLSEEGNFKNFVAFVESIVAYHKYYTNSPDE